MPRTVGIIAAPADAEVANALASLLSSDQCTCVVDAPGIESAPIAIVVCSSRAEPTTTMAGQVERAFARRARLLPVLLDVPEPPRQISHFIAGLRCLESTRTQLPAAAARLRAVIGRLPLDAPAPAPDEAGLVAAQHGRPIALNTWSLVVRSAALGCAAIVGWRLVVDTTALSAAVGDTAAFVDWARLADRLVLVQAPVAFVTAMGMVGWLQASFRELVLAHREKHVRSWQRVMGGYLLAVIYPPLAIGTVCRVWAALAEAPRRSVPRIAIVTLWWVAVVTAGAAPIIASSTLTESFLDLGAMAVDPPPATVQQQLMRLIALGDAASIVGFVLTLVIVRGRKVTPREERPDASSLGVDGPAVLVLAAQSDRRIADVLATRLRGHGIDLFASNPRHPPNPAHYDALLVLGRGNDPLAATDAAIMEDAVQTGRLPIVPVCWRSESPPSHLQARLGPLHWHTLTHEDGSLDRLAAALHRAPRRHGPARASGTRLGTSRVPGLTLIRAALQRSR